MHKVISLIATLAVLTACPQTDSTNKEIIEQASNEISIPTDNAHAICTSSTAELVHAAWVKEGAQPPHLLRVTSKNSNTKEFELGIDRSPDFLFREVEEIIDGYRFYHAHSRLIAYSCAYHNIQEIDLSLPADFKAQDAQSGMIKNLRKSITGNLMVNLMDAGELEFLVTSSGFVRVR